MRLIPLITAVLVMAVLYLGVFERARLLEFAGISDTTDDAAQTPTEPSADATAAIAKQAASDEKRVGVVAIRSVAQTIDSAVILRGQTAAARQVDVRAQISGLVISEPLRKGAFADAGDMLCQLDPGTREIALGEAEARLAEAKARPAEVKARVSEAQARLEEARINDNAARKLSKDGFASDSRVAATQAQVRAAEAGLQSATSGVTSAQAAVAAAEAAVAAARKEIERLTITAPFAGLLETDTAEIGSLLQPGALCATVLQLDPIRLVAYAAETQIGRINIGAQARGRLANGDDVAGRVSFMSRSADPKTRTFRVEVEVANGKLDIRDGQTAEIMIAADGANAHLVPQSALTLNDAGALGVRVVDDADIVSFMPVNLLRDTQDGVWIDGLPTESNIIIIGQDYVIDGVAVRASYQEPS